MYRALPARLWALLIWSILIAASLSVRPLLPVDETRYAAVAWEMWLGHDYLVPHLNGETYSHKPPLLFWLMVLGWKLFGVNDWTTRIITPLFSLATLYISSRVARLLWPRRKKTEELSLLILSGSLAWIAYSTLTMFDVMLAFFVILGIYSLLPPADARPSFRRWLLLGCAIGGGALTKGPVILLHLMPAALLAPYWQTIEKINFRWTRWYGGIALGISIGTLIALSWAIPAGIQGGEVYRNAIFFSQTRGRLVESFAHQYPWWWYFQILPLLLLPWLLLKPFWSGLKHLTLRDSGIRFCAAWIAPVFIAFSLVSGKRIHYLLPLLPALSLLLARAASEVGDSRRWERAHWVVAVIFGLSGCILFSLPWLNDYFQWRAELSSISPVWGGMLCLSAFILGSAKARDAQESVFYVSLATVLAMLIVSSGFFSLKARHFDTREAALKVSSLMSENREIAYFTGKYHGQYHYTGRLTRPMTVISETASLRAWAQAHSAGYILVEFRESDPLPKSVFSHYYPVKSHYLGLLPATALNDNPKLGSLMVPW
ncbi:MAG: ArnT family glycosyltransferase [Gammaproteobacteria bacterium]